MGRMSAVATAGAAAWVVPEILVAKPAAGATMSGNGNAGGSAGVSTGASTGGNGASGSAGASGAVGANGASGSAGVTTAADTEPSTTLASTGIDIQRDAEVGAALIAGGWAMRHWASRAVNPAAAGISDAHPAESAGDGT